MARRKKKHSAIFIASLGAHALAFVVLALVPQQKLREVVAIALQEAPPKEEKKVEPPKPRERPADRPARSPAHVAHSTPVPEAAAASAASTSAFTNLGLTLDSNSADGLAVPVPPRPAAIAPPPPPKPKVLVPRAETACTEELVKARPLDLVRPSYTDDARRARVQGRVRIELAIDDHGEVTAARVLDGLGYGLDEAALEAARRLRFTPAQRCKRSVAGPFVIAMRFVLNT